MISRNYFPLLFFFFFYTNYLTVQRCHSFSFSIRLMDHMNLGRSFLCPQVWKERKASPFGHGCDNSPSSKLTIQLIADLTLLWRHVTMEIWLSFNHRKYHWQFIPLSMHRLIRSLYKSRVTRRHLVVHARGNLAWLGWGIWLRSV